VERPVEGNGRGDGAEALGWVKPMVAVTRSDLPGAGLRRLAERAALRVWPRADPPGSNELVELIGDADAVICVNGDPVTDGLLLSCHNLRLVAVASAGYDSVDIDAAARRGILVVNTPGVLAETVADLTIALMIWTRRGLGLAEQTIRAGQWTDTSLSTLFGLDVHGATLGLVGYGAIGRAVAARTAGFGMTLLAHDPGHGEEATVRFCSLDELLRESDIVSLHVPLTSETRGLISERELRLMKATSTLINTSRGAIVDEKALLRALREGWIHSAGLDVQEREPNSDPNDPLLVLPNVVVLPHVGSATLAARASMVDLAVDNVLRFVESGLLLTPVRESLVVEARE
jgi:lactate dehydrogenase-like 2-hydroxyacid dehydrogenase